MAPPILDPIRGALLRSQPDGRLVALAREGRERALEEIVRRYREPLVAFAAMIVPAHRADDVVQESLLRAFDALPASDAEIQLRPWLFRIVRNQALNDLRDTPVAHELPDELDGVASPEEIAERRQEIAALMGGLQALPDAQREAIVGRELEGRGHAEIAAELGTSPGAVRQLIFRARATLRGAAGLVIPLPLLRFLLASGGSEAAGAATTAGVGAAAATAGGGTAGKVAVGLAGVALAVGGGIAAERGADRGDRIASAKDGGAADAGSSDAQSPRPAGSSDSTGGEDDRSGDGPGGGTGSGSSSGPSNDDGGQSGSGGGEHDGPERADGDDGDRLAEEDDSSGPGGPEDDLEEADLDDLEALDADADSSGPSVSETSGSSGSSGSGPSESSGSSGSGSSGSDSSGSGRSGSSVELDGGDNP